MTASLDHSRCVEVRPSRRLLIAFALLSGW
jgi:hypothetical protein